MVLVLKPNFSGKSFDSCETVTLQGHSRVELLSVDRRQRSVAKDEAPIEEDVGCPCLRSVGDINGTGSISREAGSQMPRVIDMVSPRS